MPRRRAAALNRTMPVEPPSSMPPGGAQFPPTLWSVVLLAGQNPSPQSEQALDTLKTKYTAGSAFQIAAVYAWRGEEDRAFEWLDRAYDQHDAGMPRLRYDPTLATLHDDSRFAALVKKMGFLE